MVLTHRALTILALLPSSLSTLLDPASPLPHSPALPLQAAHHRAIHASSSTSSPSSSGGHASSRTGAKRPKRRSVGRRTVAPRVEVGGVELEVVQRSTGGLGKREVGNGTVLTLGTSQNTFVVPIAIGSPPVTYPLQLDLASSDLLLASTLCGANCPASGGTSVNPYYDVSRSSAGFEPVNSNATAWNSSYADGTVASGFVVRETVTLGETVLQGQVMGLINATNLTLSEQKISGIVGLGFPRLSTVSHVLLREAETAETAETSTTSSEGTVSGSATASASAAAASASSSSSSYLPTLLENLVREPYLPYPVFGLALAPPPSASSTSTSSSAAPSSSSRYKMSVGSLTLGGVSSLYVDSNSSSGSGRTLQDIEWHDVVPFGAPISSNATTETAQQVTTLATGTDAESATASASETASSSAAERKRKRSNESELDSTPSTLSQLSQEEYLYWTLELSAVAVNGTNVGINSSYADIGLGSVALLDAGFNGIAGPQQDVVKLFSLITDAREVSEGQWAVPCSTRMTLGFSFGGRYIQLQPSDWMYSHISQSSFCLAWPIVQAATGDGMDWQLGTPFLKNVYSIFSYGINGEQAPLVGFLPLESNTVSDASSDSTDTTTASATTTRDPNSPTPTSIADLSLTTTYTTVLPNVVFASPTYPTPTYVYSHSPSLLATGALQYAGLGNSSAYEVEDVPVVSVEMSATTSIIGTAAADGGGQSEGTSSWGEGRAGVERVWMACAVGAGVLVGMGVGWM
ncbi:hypothetical protein IAT38_006681 [Cryptococcus sp. DSM 104549]